MGLARYKQKRDFRKTREPPPRVARTRTGRQFVVQKHAATRLHYDFRLELDGVLKSWAVPKGPSLDPADKRLAVEVEDHPVEYGEFEGTIPKGQYGGGTVMLWDRGHWTPVDKDPAAALRRGKLSFTLDGEKLRGGWTLTRMHGGRQGDDSRNWLLIKREDATARHDGKPITERFGKSVKSGRDLDEIAAAKGAEWQSSRERATSNGRARKSRSSAAAKPAAKAATPRSRRKPALEPVLDLDPSSLEGASKAPLPREFSPQLCTLATKAPTGDNWVHEIKFDGYRFLARRDRAGGVALLTRAGKDWTAKFQPIADAIAALPIDSAIIDGEASILDASGRTTFQGLQQAIKTKRFARLVFFAFDLPYLNGYDLTRVPLLERKGLLERLVAALPPDGIIRYSDHIVGSGEAMHEQVCGMQLEGVISKRADSAYEQRRSQSWLKIKCGMRQEFVIVGYTPPEGARKHFGSLLLAAHDNGRLVYTGKVGTGFDAASLKELKARLDKLARTTSPLDDTPPREDVRGAHWVTPKLVGEVQFGEWTEDGRLRHPSFQGLREDKEASAVKIEKPRPLSEITSTKWKTSPTPSRKPRRKSAATARPARRRTAPAPGGAEQADNTVAGVRISSPDRVVYPEAGYTKLDVARYYDAVADWILPFVVNRPLSTVRCPQGRGQTCFFQKHIRETFAAPVHAVRVKEKGDEDGDYITIDSREGLITLIQFGVLEIHPWGSRNDRLDEPDMLTFDLDPGEGVGFDAVKKGALLVRDVLDSVGLESFVKTSGGKGLHVVVPLARRAGWDETKAFAHAVAQRIARDHPDHYTAVLSKSKRTGKIFVDYLRNSRGATSVAAYSTRARPHAPISMPIRWEDVATLKSAAEYTIANAIAHLKKRRKDPWASFLKPRQQLTPARSDAIARGAPR